MGKSKGFADSIVGDGPIRTEFFLCPTDVPELVATVNMPSIPGSSSVSIAWSPRVLWAFVLERNDPHVVVALTVDGISGKVMQRVTQYPRSNRHREDMKKFMEDLTLLRKEPKKKKEETGGS